jgi:hypothetical protein
VGQTESRYPVASAAPPLRVYTLGSENSILIEILPGIPVQPVASRYTDPPVLSINPLKPSGYYMYHLLLKKAIPVTGRGGP